MKPLLPALLLGLGLSTATITPAAAYPVDCAILLCLAGSWPASAECAHARAVFIARITPWPIEPPLQIWNCPMHASFRTAPAMERLFAISAPIGAPGHNPISQALEGELRPVSGQTEIDISDPAFDFVRSIRVFEITYQQRRNGEGDCTSTSAVYEGRYGEQGDYARRRTSPAAVPPASDFDVPADCRNYGYRSVFVEWRDFVSTYGHEEVQY